MTLFRCLGASFCLWTYLDVPGYCAGTEAPVKPKGKAMPVRLTETATRAAIARAGQTGRRDLADAALPGLRLRLTSAGAASWALACRDPHGRMRRFPLGAFPAMGLSEARDKARSLRVRVREGEDPVAERRRARAIGRDARDGIGTLAALLELYAAGPGAELKLGRQRRLARRVEGGRSSLSLEARDGPGVGAATAGAGADLGRGAA